MKNAFELAAIIIAIVGFGFMYSLLAGGRVVCDLFDGFGAREYRVRRAELRARGLPI